MLIDSLNSEVGAVENLHDGLLSRVVNGDHVLLYANVNGFVSGSVVFYHLTPDCSAERYLPNVNVVASRSSGRRSAAAWCTRGSRIRAGS